MKKLIKKKIGASRNNRKRVIGKSNKVMAAKKVSAVNKKVAKRVIKVKNIDRVSSGIKNLDKIINGGFGKNSTNLLVGGSGNGKSIFGIQFLIDGIKHGENVLYIAFEEGKKQFYSNMMALGWNLEKLEKEGKFFFLSYTPEKIKIMLEEGGGDIETIVLTKKVQRVVVDSVTAFTMLFEDEVDMREGALALLSLFRSWTCTSLLIYERDPLIDKRRSSRVLEFEADSLIFLYFARLKKKRERFLEVYKMRGTNHSTDIFSYSIRKNIGIDVAGKAYAGDLKNFRYA